MYHVYPKTVLVISNSFCANFFAFGTHVKFKIRTTNSKLEKNASVQMIKMSAIFYLIAQKILY